MGIPEFHFQLVNWRSPPETAIVSVNFHPFVVRLRIAFKLTNHLPEREAVLQKYESSEKWTGFRIRDVCLFWLTAYGPRPHFSIEGLVNLPLLKFWILKLFPRFIQQVTGNAQLFKP